ncbi:MAG TPA: pyridoxal phosphate-dependent aminotransferase [Candidatus Saccharimonadales bacterium]|nr:pyridoxal phosphate-dependent aminotransferase [Candidatus Saccharimonadales bacterium]
MKTEPRSAPPLSERARSTPPSPTLAIDDAARQLKARGVDVLSLGAGQPDFDTPADIQEAGIGAIRKGETRYTAVAGIPDLRAAVAAKLERENGIRVSPAQVMAAAGVKPALYHALLALVGPGDEVVIPTPCWPSYPEMVRLAGGVPVEAPLSPESGFAFSEARVRQAVGPRTRVLLLNSPNNPTGAVASREALLALGQLAVEKDLWVITDEIYEKLVYGKAEHVSLAALSPEFARRTVTLNGFSKAFAMTGWRIGYAAGPAEVIEAMTALQSQTSGNCNSIAQRAAAFALSAAHPDSVGTMQAAFAARREIVLAEVAGWRHARLFPPAGAFYAFVDLSAYAAALPGGGGSVALAKHLLDSARVAVVPGAAFLEDRYQRLSYACSEPELRAALGRIRAALAELKP